MTWKNFDDWRATVSKISGLVPKNSWTALALLGAIVFILPISTASALEVTGFHRNGVLIWTNALVPGVCTIEGVGSIGGAWIAEQNFFSTNSAGQFGALLGNSNKFFRVRSVGVPATPQGFSNLVQSFGLLETLAGDGAGRIDGVSYWQPFFEGRAAFSASLSRPHYAMADRAGNIYIADKNSHSILRISTNGTIYTHAGTHLGGFNGEGPAVATNLQLNFPNSLWVRGDGTVYVLDTDNGRVRRVNTNGIMTTLFLATTDGSALSGGRTLWVKDDESLFYFGNDTRVRQWTPGAGVVTLVSGFTELGTLTVERGGDLIVCDRGAHYVYRVTPLGTKSIIAGNGTTNGGGDGFPALQTGLNGVRGVWAVPTGGFLFLTHDGSQLWYMDSASTMHLLVNGAGGTTHSGDGSYFYGPAQLKISEGRSVSLDYSGNILICESDYGYIRRIRFQRLLVP